MTFLVEISNNVMGNNDTLSFLSTNMMLNNVIFSCSLN